MPGSGKSTLVPLLTAAVPDAVELGDAVRSAVARTGSDRLSRLGARVGSDRLWDIAYARSTDRFSGLVRFTHQHPEFVGAVVQAQRERRDRDRDPEVVLEWLLNLMARFQLATERPARQSIVIDEGFAQRGVALFAAGHSGEDRPGVERYVSAAPKPDVVIGIQTPLDVCAERLDRRGWSQRLSGADEEERRRFLGNCQEVVEQISDLLQNSGTQVIWVSGTTPAPDSVLQISAKLRT